MKNMPVDSAWPNQPFQAVAPVPPHTMSLSREVRSQLRSEEEQHQILLSRWRQYAPPREHFNRYPAYIDEIDWRVPKVMYYKEPSKNFNIDPRVALDVQQKRLVEGDKLEKQLSVTAWEQAIAELAEVGLKPPAPEKVAEIRIPFQDVHSLYEACDDAWERRVQLRSLRDAMSGDASQPLVKPVVFDEDDKYYVPGHFVQDNSWIF